MSNWQSYLKEYKNYLKLERGLSANTIENYSFDIEKLITFLNLNAIEVTPINITEEIVHKKQSILEKRKSEKQEARKLKPNVDILEVNIKDEESIKKVVQWIKFKTEMR